MEDEKPEPEGVSVEQVRVILAVTGMAAILLLPLIWLSPGTMIRGLLLPVAGLFAGGYLWKRSNMRRATRRWEAASLQVIRTEKITHLGHALGGLSDPDRAEVGLLSDAGAGRLSQTDG